ncbi:hypothetical protein NM604_2187 [Neisseria meningitidis NM604]|nr:hypothetical protein NM604_2187 [Neisseria meningitidis NM604]
MGKRVHIGKKRLKQVVGFPCQGEAAQDFRPFSDRCGKVFPRVFCFADGNADKCLKPQVDGFRRQQRGILADDAGIFQLL